MKTALLKSALVKFNQYREFFTPRSPYLLGAIAILHFYVSKF
ncbi:hypothetical protein [Scytonema sp. NUACC21]